MHLPTVLKASAMACAAARSLASDLVRCTNRSTVGIQDGASPAGVGYDLPRVARGRDLEIRIPRIFYSKSALTPFATTERKEAVSSANRPNLGSGKSADPLGVNKPRGSCIVRGPARPVGSLRRTRVDLAGGIHGGTHEGLDIWIDRVCNRYGLRNCRRATHHHRPARDRRGPCR